MSKAIMLTFVASFLAISATAKPAEISLLNFGTTNKADVKANLFEELDEMKKEGKEVMQVGIMAELAGKVTFKDERFSKLASALEPMYATLPKNAYGRLDHSVVRYALHRLLVQRYGWYIQGLEPDGAARNDSSQGKLKKWVPDFLQEVLERRIGGTGYSLPDVVALAATFERLVQNEAASRLEGIFQIMEIDVEEQIYSSSEIDDIVDLYLTTYLRGGNLSASGPDQALLRLSIFRSKYKDWNNVKEWVNELVENTTGIAIPADFDQFVDVAEAIGENFATFNSLECTDLKRTLLQIEDQRQGRVNISQFYKMGLHSHWKFTEKVDYLKALGALDDSDPANLAVIVSNYIMSMPNCLGASNFYSICCRNECDELLASLENDVQGPVATPDRLIELVSNLASDTVTAPRQLSPALVSRLHQVADTHSGRVPLHGRLFAQWMHHAFPRECPFPHEVGTISPQTADEWMQANGQESAQASEEEMVCHVNGDCGGTAASTLQRASYSLELPWSDQEELLIELRPQDAKGPLSSTASTAASLHRFNNWMRNMALMSVAAGLAMISKTLMDKPADDPNAKMRKRSMSGLGNTLVFLVVPIFVIIIDCCVGAYSSNDLLLSVLCFALAALIMCKRFAAGGLSLDMDAACSGTVV